MGTLDARTAVVTGGASGLGQAIATRLAADGAKVVITDVQVELGEQVAADGGFTFIAQDVRDEARWAEVVDDVEKRVGPLRILVNNAGILGRMHSISPENTTLEDWRTMFAINVEGVFLGCREAIRAMRATGVAGSIVNMSSVAGLLATPYATAYGASKATVRQLTKSVAQHCAQEGLNVRCNSVHPGIIRTPLWNRGAEETARLRGIPLEDHVAETRATIPMGDFTLAEDVAASVAFLSSDDARHVTGSKLIVDGGFINCDTFMLKAERPSK
jgi:NAD(P)-dependent dehydrogenase (short-subunit alcohol dehydrogenase family)